MTLRIGVTANNKELPAALAAFPGSASCRVFGGPGKGIPSWTSAPMSTLRKAGVLAWPSFKDWATDPETVTKINTWLDTLPDDVPETWLTYHHEPEGDFASKEYRRRWVILAKTVRAHRNASRVKLVPIHLWWPSRYKMWDRYHTDWTQWIGIWQQWAPTRSDGSYLGDYMGWDCYLPVNSTVYEPPEVFFRTPIGAAHTMGVPLVIPELGAINGPGDAAGTRRAQWIADCIAYLRQQNVLAVNWWQATGTAGHDYRLDPAGSRVWKDATAQSASTR